MILYKTHPSGFNDGVNLLDLFKIGAILEVATRYPVQIRANFNNYFDRHELSRIFNDLTRIHTNFFEFHECE